MLWGWDWKLGSFSASPGVTDLPRVLFTPHLAGLRYLLTDRAYYSGFGRIPGCCYRYIEGSLTTEKRFFSASLGD